VLARIAGASRQSEGAPVQIEGDPDHPANRGALCSKGAALGETLGLEGRLLKPRVQGCEAGWEEALQAAAGGLQRTIEKHGPDSVAFYVSGQLLTEDYYVANKLMKGFIGSANIDTNSRLCMSSAVAAHKRAFGEDVVPGCYEDLELADLIVLVGSNTAWCHPVLFRRIMAAKESRPDRRLVVIDPRRTPTCDAADLHLPLRPGSDVMLFNGLLAWLARSGAVNWEFLARLTRGGHEAMLVAENRAGDVAAVARHCGLEANAVQCFYEWFAGTPRVVTAFSQGVNQSSSGTDKANSIINVHLATGRIGHPGMGPFSITGQPNAMGGREVGGLATMLAAHLEIENASHRALVQDFWHSPSVPSRPGLKAVDMFEAVHQGRIKAIWIMATNPIVSLPNADRARAALKRCELVIVSECTAHTDTTALAHVLFPASAWGEKEGTVTNSERRISRQRAFLPPPADVRPDWWIICQVAQRLGFTRDFDYTSAAQIFDEHASLSAQGNAGSRAFNLEGLVGLSEQQYSELAPTQWPVRRPAELAGTVRLCADGFYHPDRRARLIPTVPRAPKFDPDEEYPMVLNTGRIRDQWHTMTRTGRAPRLNGHLPEPFADLNPADALRLGVREGGLARIVTRWGSMVARVCISGEILPGAVFVPIHWSDRNASDARVGALVNPAVDALSGEPEFKHTPARIEPFVVSWHAFLLTRRPVDLRALSWWTVSHGSGHLRCELAGRSVPGDWSGWTRRLLGAGGNADWLEYEDRGSGIYRAAYCIDGRLEACLFVSPRTDLPSRVWLGSLFGGNPLRAEERRGLLFARAPDPASDTGMPVCACFGVGRRAIESSIAQGCRDARDIGARLRAGTNCGSCVPELKRLIALAASG
jgi:assimilatory nitrate reductase catalytic subunit